MTRSAEPLKTPERARDDAFVSGLLQTARGRLRLTRLVRGLSVATPLAIAAVVLLRWGGVPSAIWLAVGGVAAVVITAVFAAARTPSVSGVASLLDARLLLADRVTTALKMMPRSDAVARFIVRDAAGRLSPRAIAGVLPYSAHPRMAVALIVCLACVALWAAAPAPPRGRAGLGGGGASFGDAASRGGAGNPEAGTAAPGPGAERAADGTTPARERPRQAPADRSAHSSGDEGGGRVSAGAREAGDGTPAQRREGGDRSGSPAEAASRAGGAAPAAASRSASGTSGSQARGRAEAAAPGAASAANGPIGNGAGGVQRGTLVGAGVGTRASASRPLSAEVVRRARDGAEAAIAHDDVPPRHRAYVRDYFRAIGRLNEP